MIDEALIQTIVRNVVQRLQNETAGGSTSENVASHGLSETKATVEDLYQTYRARHLQAAPFEERFSVGFDSSLPVELGRPLVCLYEKHQPCDGCGRCEVRGF